MSDDEHFGRKMRRFNKFEPTKGPGENFQNSNRRDAYSIPQKQNNWRCPPPLSGNNNNKPVNKRLQLFREGPAKPQNLTNNNSNAYFFNKVEANNFGHDCQPRNTLRFSPPPQIDTSPVNERRTNAFTTKVANNVSNHNSSRPPHEGGKVNIYKNLRAWAEPEPVGAQPKKNIAQERLKRLKTVVVKNRTFNNPNKSEENEVNAYISPLLQGVKRPLNSEESESSNATKSDSSIRQMTPDPPKKKIRVMMVKNEDKPKPLVEEAGKKCEDDAKSSVFAATPECSKSYMERMKRTANWVLSSHKEGDNDKTEPAALNNSISTTFGDSSFASSRLDLSEEEEMEWTNAEPVEEAAPPAAFTVKNSEPVPESLPGKSQNLCIVVDTNIFINSLSKLKDVINMKVAGPSEPVLYIPWMVVTELDFMKDSVKNSSLKTNIVNSIKFINKCLSENHPRLIGQTAPEAHKQATIGSSQDDKIIACCLQVSEKYESVILLSNDLNLKNKALIHKIKTCSANEVIMKVASKLTKNTKSQRIQHKLGVLFSTVICEYAKETFGDAWTKMDMLSRPPWSFYECLKRLLKYWTTIFQEKLMKQCIKAIMDLLAFLKAKKCIMDDSKEYVEFVKLCVHLCVFFKDLEEFQQSFNNILSEIERVA